MQISSLRKNIGTGYFHRDVEGPDSFYCVAEQPVSASYSKRTDGVLGKAIGNLALGSCRRFSM